MIRLCGLHKKGIGPALNLHELPGVMGKTFFNQGTQALQGDTGRKQPLLPVVAELPEGITYGGMIDIREAELEVKNRIISGPVPCYFTMDFSRE